MRVWVFGLAMLFYSAAKGNVFGVDRRVAVAGNTRPAEAIGLVQQVDGQNHVLENCTGTLIGPRLVLTAAHCVARAGTGLDPKIATIFLPNVSERLPPKNHTSRTAIGLWAGPWRTDNDSRAGDWAVLLLNEAPALATRPQYLEVRDALPAPGQKIALMGYSIDFEKGETLSADLDCRVRKVLADGVFHHDCALFAGASGGPILQKDGEHWTVIGVQSAHKSDGTIGLRLAGYEPRFANLGARASLFLGLLAQLKHQYDTPPPTPIAGK